MAVLKTWQLDEAQRIEGSRRNLEMFLSLAKRRIEYGRETGGSIIVSTPDGCRVVLTQAADARAFNEILAAVESRMIERCAELDRMGIKVEEQPETEYQPFCDEA